MAYFPFIATPAQQTRPAVQISNSRDPVENPLALPFLLDFSVADTYQIDLSTSLQRGVISGIQTLYFDNSGNTGAVVVTIQGSDQVLKLPPGAEGYLPILCPQPIIILFDGTSATTAPVMVALINAPMPLGVWFQTP